MRLASFDDKVVWWAQDSPSKKQTRRFQMDLFEAVQARRSIRKFSSEKFPDANIRKAIEAAILAPNSSNLQVWDFYWVQTEEARKELIHHCVNQSAARTASDLMVVVADPDRWKRAQPPMLEHLK